MRAGKDENMSAGFLISGCYNSRAVIGLRLSYVPFQPPLCLCFWTLGMDRQRYEHQHQEAPISAFSRQEVERKMPSQEEMTWK